MQQTSVKAVVTALETELARSKGALRLAGHPGAYYIGYLFRDVEGFSIWGRFGSLYHSRPQRHRSLYADVRVGSYRFDQTTQGGLSDNSDEVDSFDYIDMPLDDDVDALRYAIWRLTDARYREAATAFHERNCRQITYQDQNAGYPSFVKSEALVDCRRAPEVQLDQGYWEAYVRDASRMLKDAGLHNCSVEFNAQVMTKIFVSSEGRRLLWRNQRYGLVAHLWRLPSNGEPIELDVVVNTSDPRELPTLEEFQAQIEARIRLMGELENADRMTSYSGPVLMAPVPAGLFVHEVLGHRLEGNRLLSDDEGHTFKDKMGRKISHASLTVYDDPTVKRYRGKSLIGHYRYDDEGTEPERVNLVQQGKLKGLLSSRAAIKGRGHKSNGHARNENHERPISRMGNLFISGNDGKSWAELKALLIAEITHRRLPFGIILLEADSGETGTEAYDFQAFLGRITVAKKIFPNGEERFVRGVDFVGTPLAGLSQVLAVGDTPVVDNGYCGAESGTIPVSTISPALLLGSLELQAQESTRLTPYILPLPWERQAKRLLKRTA